MNRILPIILLLLTGTFASGQKKVTIRNAVGREVIAGNLTQEAAKAKALIAAKLDALRKAGVSEHIRSYEMLYRSEIGTRYDEVFMSDILSEIRGAVCGYKVVKETKGIDEHQNFYIEIIIDADVVHYKNGCDPAFRVSIEGIEKGYKNGEKLTYTITPTKDCYLNIFNIYERNATLIYPNHYEKCRLFKAGETVKFPLSNLIDGYTLERSTPEPEQNKLLFVFTRDKIPYISIRTNREGDQETSFEEISSWMFSISPEKRTNYLIQFVIY